MLQFYIRFFVYCQTDATITLWLLREYIVLPVSKNVRIIVLEEQDLT